MVDPGAMNQAEILLIELPQIEPADLGADATIGWHDLDCLDCIGQGRGLLRLLHDRVLVSDTTVSNIETGAN